MAAKKQKTKSPSKTSSSSKKKPRKSAKPKTRKAAKKAEAKAKTPKATEKRAKVKAPKPAEAPNAAKKAKAPKPTDKKPSRGGAGTAILHALVGVLAQRKLLDAETYVAPLGDLLAEAGHPRTAAVEVTKARALRNHLTLTVTTTASEDAAERALVGFVEDAKGILASPQLLVELLQEARDTTNQLFTLSQLREKLFSEDQEAFETHWSEAIGERRLPEGIGSLQTNGKSLLFFLNDIVQAPPDHASDEPPPPSAPLRERLLEAFDELDVAGGRRNYVTLFDLRNRLPDVGRDGFDAAVKELRREWILTLDPAEGRHERLPEQVLAAGIMDQSSLLVYAARRDA